MSQPFSSGTDSGGTLDSSTGVGPSMESSEGINAGQEPSVGQPSNGEGTTESAGGNAPEFRPEWNPLLEVVPSQFHTVIAPTLKQWDRNYNALAQEFAPFKKNFVAKGVTVEDLQNANNLYQSMNANPTEMFRRMAYALAQQGVDVNALLPLMQEEQDPNDPNNSGDGGDNGQQQQQQQQDPVISQMQQQLQQQNEMIQNWQYEQQVASVGQQMDAEIQQIKNADPNVNIGDLLNRYAAQITMAEQAARNGVQVMEPSLQRAYQEQQAFIQSLNGGNTGNNQPAGGNPNAPRVMPTGGGMPPATPQAQSYKSQEERIGRAMQLINAANAAQQG